MVLEKNAKNLHFWSFSAKKGHFGQFLGKMAKTVKIIKKALGTFFLHLQGGHQKFGFQIEDNRGQKEQPNRGHFYQIVYVLKTCCLWLKVYALTKIHYAWVDGSKIQPYFNDVYI